MLLEQERLSVLKHCQMLQSHNLIKGTGGNVSVINREMGLVAISPSAVEYEKMRVEDVAVIDLDGNHVDGACGASSERMMHLSCYRVRDDIGGVVHTHSLYATVLACMNKEIPEFYYLQVCARGGTRCIPYYSFGSQELADAVKANLGDRNSLLLGNHGLLAVGDTLEQAFSVAELTEFAAEVYTNILKAGEPRLMSAAEMQDTMARLANYKKREV